MENEITAEQIVELFERDDRRRLAVLLVSEPEVRLAIVNVVLREVATKQDLRELREKMSKAIRELREEMRNGLRRLREGLERVARESGEYTDKRFAELKEYVDSRFDRLETEVRNLRERLWWVVATVILGWIGVILTQFF